MCIYYCDTFSQQSVLHLLFIYARFRKTVLVILYTFCWRTLDIYFYGIAVNFNYLLCRVSTFLRAALRFAISKKHLANDLCDRLSIASPFIIDMLRLVGLVRW